MGVVTKPDLASGRVVVGNASNKGDDVAITGDVSLSSDGAATVDNVTVGSDAVGDINYKTAATTSSRVGIGSLGDALGVNAAGTAPEWSTQAEQAKKYTKITGSHIAPVCGIAAGTAATGADTTITNCILGPGLPVMVIYNTGTNDTRVGPDTVVDANCTDGMQLPSTNTDNVGGTITFGASMLDLLATTGAPTCYTVGTDPAFYLECRIGIPDVSDYDVLGIGFVSPEAAYVAAIDQYSELQAAYDEKIMFTLADNAGDVDINTSKATTDANTDLSVDDWTDDDVMTMRINVSAAGVTTYRWWDKTATEDTSTGAAAFTATATAVLTPCIIYAKAANAADTPPIIEYIEWGYQ